MTDRKLIVLYFIALLLSVHSLSRNSIGSSKVLHLYAYCSLSLKSLIMILIVYKLSFCTRELTARRLLSTKLAAKNDGEDAVSRRRRRRGNEVTKNLFYSLHTYFKYCNISYFRQIKKKIKLHYQQAIKRIHQIGSLLY